MTVDSPFPAEALHNQHTVIKKDDPNRMRVEAQKTTHAYEIGKASGLFQVPKILDYDESNGVLVLERIKNIDNISSVLTSGYERKKIVEKVAVGLAVIHKELQLPANMLLPLPQELVYPGDEVFIHGDLSVKNICVTRNSGEIVILDWQTTSMHGGTATYGTRYFDVVWFVNNLLCLMSRIDRAYKHSKHAMPTILLFLKNYIRESNTTEGCDELVDYMKIFFKYKLEQRKINDTLKSKLLHILLRQHVKKLIDNPKLKQQLIGECV